MSEYPEPCCRCGFCCLAEICPNGKTIFNEQGGPCPALSFAGDTASCTLAGKVFTHDEMGIGKGCCIKARVFLGSSVYSFALLPEKTKKSIASQVRGIASTCEPLGTDRHEEKLLKQRDDVKKGKILIVRRE